MHQDQKIGLSLAVLLIGFAGAFCFRHEPALNPQQFALDRAEELDLRIEHLPIRAYTEREGVTPSDDRESPPPAADTEGPLSDILEIGRPARGSVTDEQDREPNLVPLFAGPPEPLRIPSNRSAVPEAPASSARASVARDTKAEESARRSGDVPHPGDQVRIDRSSTSASPIVEDGSSTPRAPTMINYTVRSGDTLSELAQRFLGSSRRYHELYEANRDVLSSPHTLRVGMELRIPAEH